MILKSDWRYKLASGDEVKWNDCENANNSIRGIIGSIEYGNNNNAIITWQDGNKTHVFLDELYFSDELS